VVVFLLLAIMLLAFALGWGVKDLRTDDAAPKASASADGGSSQAGSSSTSAVVDEICSVLRAQHVDGALITDEMCREAAINGVVTSLNDPHTAYITPEEMEGPGLDMGSTYQGIGASVSDATGQVQIVAPFRDSPAEKAGIRPGDIVLEVDGDLTDGWSDSEAVKRIRGKAGTPVTLKVKHTDGTTETVTITRGDIPITSVYTEPNLEIIPGESGTLLVDRDGKEAADIAYIAISQFHDNTINELRQAAKGLEGKGYKGLILDLRSNPGGLLSSVVAVADEFLDGGTIITEVDAAGKSKSWTAKSGGALAKLPIVVIQDQASASASEVLAAALRDNGRAKIVGTRSFGKGTVNQLIEIKNCNDPAGCGAMYVAVGRWLTPKNDQIEGLGVKPDIEVEMTRDDYVDKGDVQVFQAIDTLRGK
ncbi:S41 family peptidase, partial [bacterium]